MAISTAVRPSIGRIISSIGNQHAANTSILAALSIGATQGCPFSSTPERCMRKPRRDNNRLRGLSSIYRSGPRYRMNIDPDQMPQPAYFKPEIKVDPEHGLWDFFYSKEKLLLTPDEDSSHGRGWSVEELRHKSWDDLHKLWWVCIKEQNRISTARKEKARMRLLSGDRETAERLRQVRRTMKGIKHTLTERFYLWEDARRLAETDPEIDLSSPKRPYLPSSYMEETMEKAEESEAALEGQEGQEAQEGQEGREGQGVQEVQGVQEGQEGKEAQEGQEGKEVQEVQEGEQEGTQEESKKSGAEEVDPSTLPPQASEEAQQPSAKA
ncbi:54S ribosomal protein L4 mitochondrial [Parahypoxylon ruwenzoriense]